MSTQQSRSERIQHSGKLVSRDAVAEFVALLQEALPETSVSVDEPSNTSGEWFIDVTHTDFEAQVSWQPSHGFGLFTAPAGYGDRPNEIFASPAHAALRVTQLYLEWQHTRRISAIHLSQLRSILGIQQSALASALSLSQPAISRFESRDDVKISTLSSYVEAIGGRLDIRAIFDNVGISVDLYSA